jgi:hypothetical protein
MWNYVKFGKQIEAFERYLYENLSDRKSPPITKFIPCHEGPNGEWVPDQESDSGLEEAVSEA